MLKIVKSSFHLNKKDQPYGDNFEYLEDLKKCLDLKIYFYLKKLLKNSSGEENLKGLIIPREEIDNFLNKLEGVNTESNDGRENYQDLQDFRIVENYIATRIELTVKTEFFLPLEYLCQAFDLNDFEKHCLLLGMVVHYDRVYEKIFGYIQDDISLKYPTLDTVVKLFSPQASDKDVLKYSLIFERKLAKYFFLRADYGWPKLAFPLQLDKRILDIIVGNVEEGIPPFLRVFNPEETLPPLIIHKEIQDSIQNIINNKRSKIFYFYGPPGSGKRLQVKHLARSLERALIFVDGTKLITSDGRLDILNINTTLRELIIYDAIFCLVNFNQLINDNNYGSPLITDLLREINKKIDLIFLIADTEDSLPEVRASINWFEVQFKIPTRKAQKKLWVEFSKGFPLDPQIDVGELANKFDFLPGQIDNALNQAETQAQWQGKEVITKDILYKVCHQQINHRLLEKAVLIKASYGFDDLILPQAQKQQLLSACNQVRFKHIVYDEWGFEEKLAYGKGLSMLFAGPPGTGKTMAAQVIAKEVGLELYKIDLSQIVSKYIGETEKNLKEIFAEGQRSNVILFFDEVDALLGKRTEQKDAHDKYANLEIAFLLQIIEDYQGIAIMATNFLHSVKLL